MNIELHRIKVRDLVDGYVDDAESGVRGYVVRLDIRISSRWSEYNGKCRLLYRRDTEDTNS